MIVGPPGSGKSTAARAVAARTGLASRDTDEDVEARTGSRIGDLFVEHGEDYFRGLEREAVAAALAEHDGVLARRRGSGARRGDP